MMKLKSLWAKASHQKSKVFHDQYVLASGADSSQSVGGAPVTQVEIWYVPPYHSFRGCAEYTHSHDDGFEGIQVQGDNTSNTQTNVNVPWSTSSEANLCSLPNDTLEVGQYGMDMLPLMDMDLLYV